MSAQCPVAASMSSTGATSRANRSPPVIVPSGLVRSSVVPAAASEGADLAGEDGVPDAELAGCVVKAGLAGEGEEPADALLGTWAGEHVPDVRGERAGSAEGGERVSAAGDAVPDADARLAGRGGEGLDRGAGLGGDAANQRITDALGTKDTEPEPDGEEDGDSKKAS
jgi:hypothetical protein